MKKNSSIFSSLLGSKRPSELSLLKKIEVTNEHIFKYTSRISIELSNLCNYSEIHKKCPLSLANEPIILPARIVFDILNTLKHHDFQGIIAYHTYNEPLIDPRLIKFVEYARDACPKSKIFIGTNGFYLNQTLLDELVDSGVSEIHVSVYFKSEFERLSMLTSNIPLNIEIMHLDDRLLLYKAKENNIKRPCYAPLNEIIVAREGCISLCCLDWKRLYTFGNLEEQTFDEVIRSGELQAVYERLSKGDRFLPICKRCGGSR